MRTIPDLDTEIAGMNRDTSKIEHLKKLAAKCGADADLMAQLDGEITKNAARTAKLETEKAAVMTAVETLTDQRYRDVMRCRFVEGLTAEATGEKLHYCIGHVIRLTSKARAEIKEGVENGSGNEEMET